MKTPRLKPLSTIPKIIIDDDVYYDIESYPITPDANTASGLSGYGTFKDIISDEGYVTQFINASQVYLFDNFNVVDSYVLASFARYLLEVLAREYTNNVFNVEQVFSTFTAQFAKFAKMNGFNSILSPSLIANNRTDMQYLNSSSSINLNNAIDTETLNTQIQNIAKEKELLSALESDQQANEHVASASAINKDIIQNVVQSFNELVNSNNTASASASGVNSNTGTAITGNQNFGLAIPLPELSAQAGGTGQNTAPFINNQIGNPQLLNTNVNNFATAGEVTGSTQHPTLTTTATGDGNVGVNTGSGSSQDATNNASEQAQAGKNDTITDNVAINVNTAVGSNFLQTNNSNTQSTTGTVGMEHDATDKNATLSQNRETGYRQSPLWAQNLISLLNAYNEFNINSLVIEAFAWLRPLFAMRAWGDDNIIDLIGGIHWQG